MHMHSDACCQRTLFICRNTPTPDAEKVGLVWNYRVFDIYICFDLVKMPVLRGNFDF